MLLPIHQIYFQLFLFSFSTSYPHYCFHLRRDSGW